jgi:hypothetical protein
MSSSSSLCVVIALLSTGAMSCPVVAAASRPDFAPNPNVGWVALQGGFQPPSGGGAGPVLDDPNHPTVTNDDFRISGKQPSFPVADLNNPVLKPWVRDVLRKRNEDLLAGEQGFGPRQNCWLVGVPAFWLAAVFQPIFLIQSAKEVVMVAQTDNHQIRHIYLDVPHTANLRPSWFGESVGHYDGDTLVVDTVGLNDRTVIDDHMTPHTGRLHVIERLHMTDSGRMLEVDIHVEDPGAFTMPWNAIQRLRRSEPGVAENALIITNDATTGRSAAGPLLEESCSENSVSWFDNTERPIPRADRPEF